jgi:hypothetical protein
MNNLTSLRYVVWVHTEKKFSDGKVKREDTVKISSCAFESRNEIRLKSARYL